MKIFTIGFTKKSAKRFFETIERSGATKLVDVRLNNVSQLAGFAKRHDLEFFLSRICSVGYSHVPELAPTQEMLDQYRKVHHNWETYEIQFRDLMEKRQIEDRVPRDLLDNACLLCSEDKPHHCHRRIVVDYLSQKWEGVEIVHL